MCRRNWKRNVTRESGIDKCNERTDNMTREEAVKRANEVRQGSRTEDVRCRAIRLWAGVQIVIGGLLLVGTAYMAMSLLPKLRNGVGQIGEKLAAAAEAVREDNEAYCEFATNLFSLSGSIGDVADNFDVIGREVVKTGRSLHFELPVLKNINDVGDSVRNIGNDILNVAAAIRKERAVMDGFRNRVHPQNSSSINDAAEVLTEVSDLMQNGSMVNAYGWYVVLLGVLLSVLFIMNGMMLLALGKDTKGY